MSKRTKLSLRAASAHVIETLEYRRLLSGIGGSPSGREISASGDEAAVAGVSYTLDLSASGLGTQAVAEWIIDWGDGSEPESVDGTETDATHSYEVGGAMTIHVEAQLDSLKIVDDGDAPDMPDAGVVKLAALDIESTAQLDLENNALIITDQSRADVEGIIADGFGAYGHGDTYDWDGYGLASSDAAAIAQINASTAIGVIVAGDMGYTEFCGVPVDETDVLVKYTYTGDADLDGDVDGNDEDQYTIGHTTSEDRWFTGDFDYGGFVDPDDFNAYGAGYTAYGLAGAITQSGPAVWMDTLVAENFYIDVLPPAPELSNDTVLPMMRAVTLRWTDVPGADHYGLQRNDGSGWTFVANITDLEDTDSYRYIDNGVEPDTEYDYKITAVNIDNLLGGYDTLEHVLTAPYAEVWDNLYKIDGPNDWPEMPWMWAYPHLHQFDQDHVNTYLTTFVDDAINQGHEHPLPPLAVDWEAFSSNPTDRKAEMENLITWVRAYCVNNDVDITLGIWGSPPGPAPINSNDPEALATWQANAEILRELKDFRPEIEDELQRGLDFLTPYAYTHLPSTSRKLESTNDWALDQQAGLVEAASWGLPVYGYLEPNYEPPSRVVPADYWKLELALLARYADGAVIWGGSDFGDEGEDPELWYPALQEFIDERDDSITPSAPGSLSVDHVGNHLSWTDPYTPTLLDPTNESAFIIERSADNGSTWKFVGAIPRDTEEYTDSRARPGTYKYRVGTLMANGNVTYATESSQAASTRDAYDRIEVEYMDHAHEDTAPPEGRYAIADEGWLHFGSVDFGSSLDPAQQVMMDIAGSGVLQVDIIIDATYNSTTISGGTLIGTVYSDIGDVQQSADISSTYGVHDVFLKFTSGANSQQIDWIRFLHDEKTTVTITASEGSGYGTVDLSWDDVPVEFDWQNRDLAENLGAAEVDHYDIYYSTSSTATTLGSKVGESDDLSETVTVGAGTTYYFKIIAVDTKGCAIDFTDKVSKFLTVTPALSMSGNDVHVEWPAFGNVSDTYEVWREEYSESTYTQIGSATSSLSMNDTTAEPGWYYKYKVKAVSASLWRGPEVIFTPPSGVSAVPNSGAGTVTISWDALDYDVRPLYDFSVVRNTSNTLDGADYLSSSPADMEDGELVDHVSSGTYYYWVYMGFGGDVGTVFVPLGPQTV